MKRKNPEARKTEYRQREDEGKELIINSFGVTLGLSNDQVTVKKDGKILVKRRTDALSHITISSKGVSLSSNLIYHCLENGITIDFFTLGGKHSGCILSPDYIEGSLWTEQLHNSPAKRTELAATIIEAKLRNQFNLIKYFHKYHKTTDNALTDRYNDMSKFSTAFRSFLQQTTVESENYMSKLLGFEAQGAVKYWAYIRQLLSDDEVKFEKRERRGATDLVNCMLNYGYSMLYARVWQALLEAKLNPYDSVIHVRQAGKPTFVYDVVEIFRSQVVDRVVIKLIQKGMELSVADGLLSAETRKILAAAILDRLNRHEKYRSEMLTLEQIIKRQAREIAAWIGSGETYRPYIAKW